MANLSCSIWRWLVAIAILSLSPVAVALAAPAFYPINPNDNEYIKTSTYQGGSLAAFINNYATVQDKVMDYFNKASRDKFGYMIPETSLLKYQITYFNANARPKSNKIQADELCIYPHALLPGATTITTYTICIAPFQHQSHANLHDKKTNKTQQ